MFLSRNQEKKDRIDLEPFEQLQVLQQVTKWLNTKYQLGKAVLGAFRK